MYVFFILFKWWLFSKRILFYLRREKNKRKKKREWKGDAPVGEKEKKVWSCPWAPQFSTFYKKAIQQCCYLKTKYWYGLAFKIYVLNTLKHVTQTPIINYRYQICFFFLTHNFQYLNIENFCLNIVTKQALDFLFMS